MPVLVDAHVHIYPNFNWERALAAVASRVAPTTQISLLLTESRGHDFFSTLQPIDSCCAHLEIASRSIFIFSGRQLVSSEGIEIHALLTRETFNERRPFRELMAEVRQSGALIALPWSPGKWLGKRAAIIERVIDESPAESLLLSDSRLRPIIWPYPRFLARAEGRGIKVLRGSDPLPYKGEEYAIGSYASLVDDQLPKESPTESMHRLLTTTKYQPFGGRPLLSIAWLKSLARLKA